MATNDTTDRAVRSLTDVAVVEQIAPGMVRVVTWSDCYVVDARGGGCNCPDKQYNEPGTCKHEYAARLFDGDTVARPTVDDDLSTATTTDQVATDGGHARPTDCECMDEYVNDDPLPCFPCVRDGFDTPNPSPPTDEDMVDSETEPVAVADGGETADQEPTRHEPADMGGGETTGVQDL